MRIFAVPEPELKTPSRGAIYVYQLTEETLDQLKGVEQKS